MATRKQLTINWNDGKRISQAKRHSGDEYLAVCARIGAAVLTQLGITGQGVYDPIDSTALHGNRVTVGIDIEAPTPKSIFEPQQ